MPDWGEFDMAVGKSVPSVFAGTADKLKHNVFPPKSKRKAIPIEYGEKEKELFRRYKAVRDMREQKNIQVSKLAEIFNTVRESHSDSWLLPLEIYELVVDKEDTETLQREIISHLEQIRLKSDELDDVISSGLELSQKSIKER